MSETTGRRERKKAATRAAIADAALELFLAHGYEAVGVKDVAAAADVAVTTLFKHFGSKEALVFDRDEELEASLVAAVRDRGERSIPQALRDHATATTEDAPGLSAFVRLVEENPALREYGRRVFLRHEATLAQVIAREVGAPLDDPVCAALARFALDAHSFAHERADPVRALDAAFALLEGGFAPRAHLLGR